MYEPQYLADVAFSETPIFPCRTWLSCWLLLPQFVYAPGNRIELALQEFCFIF
jgi:hypothetical protein